MNKGPFSFLGDAFDACQRTEFKMLGNIEYCHCTCIAGLGGACSHAAAILFYAEYIEKKKNDTSITDVPAYWKKGPKKNNMSPKKMSEIPFQNAKTMYTKSKTKAKKQLNINKNILPRRASV